jgi:peptide chain release factor 1
VSLADQGGFKEIIFLIEGKSLLENVGPLGIFKYEGGVHRVQRVPLTEASGRIHTSTITVAVLPEAEEVEVQVRNEDLRIDTYRASGHGGQHLQKTDSAVRITHLPTGLVVQCQDERSQQRNREKAMKLLRAKLFQMAQDTQSKKITSDRKVQVGTGERSEKIRTYNFPQDRITDHRIGMNFHNIPKVLDGQLGPIVEALQLAEQREKETG